MELIDSRESLLSESSISLNDFLQNKKLNQINNRDDS